MSCDGESTDQKGECYEGAARDAAKLERFRIVNRIREKANEMGVLRSLEFTYGAKALHKMADELDSEVR